MVQTRLPNIADNAEGHPAPPSASLQPDSMQSDGLWPDGAGATSASETSFGEDLAAKKNPVGKRAQYVASLAFWIVLWGIAAVLVNNQIVLAGPLETLQSLAQFLITQSFWSAVGVSTVRILLSALGSAVLGIALGAAAACWNIVRIVLAPPLQVLKSAPVACVAVLFLVVAGSAGTIPIIVAMVALPPFFVATLQAHDELQGAEHQRTRSALLLMGAPARAVFFAITWPTYLKYYATSAKTAIGLSWRAGITAELLGIPLGSIGSAIYAAKITLDTPALLAWVVCIMTFSVLCEWVVCKALGWLGSSARMRWVSKHRTSGPSEMNELFTERANTSSTANKLAAIAVTKCYGGSTVLESITLELFPGDRMCVMAPTGSGKTTLLNVLLGQVKVNAGWVQRPDYVGVVMQLPTLVPDLTALQNVMLVTDDERAAREALDELLPAGCTDKKASDLSGGTRRLTEMVRCMFSCGAAVVMDEPFAGLDNDAHKRACAFILEKLNNRPLLVATHNKEDAALLDARIVMLRR